ncbi:MAG: helix-turn-helix transcriptional regulator [Bradyrhizobiaceae bacterium]|nr:helix-turn-helix transcriptional regulator [Bradyrhizobiaceae bacterium]
MDRQPCDRGCDPMPRKKRDPRKPDAVDVAVGVNVRTWRIARGLSQGELAQRLGITFQQVQKYETGHNRMTTGRLAKPRLSSAFRCRHSLKGPMIANRRKRCLPTRSAWPRRSRPSKTPRSAWRWWGWSRSLLHQCRRKTAPPQIAPASGHGPRPYKKGGSFDPPAFASLVA